MSRARTPLPRAGELDDHLHAEGGLDSRGRRLRGLHRTACVIARGCGAMGSPAGYGPGQRYHDGQQGKGDRAAVVVGRDEAVVAALERIL